jgi:hypothetical protein
MDGEYEIQIRLTRDRNEHVEGLTEAHDLELLLDRERVQLFTVTPPQREAGFSEDYQPNHDNVDQHLKIRVPVSAGPHALGVAFLKNPSALLETARQPYQAHFNFYRHPRIQPAVFAISIIGPYAPKGPGETPSRRRIFVSRPANPDEEAESARRILRALMRRAYRRPVTDRDLEGPFELYQQARAEGGFEAGIEMALRSILMSPKFLFRIESQPPKAAANAPYRISDLDLASRLSFFLWSSIPDDQLLDLAVKKTLSKPEVLQQQVRRMLADPRSQALVENFAGQWLHIRNVAVHQPSPETLFHFDDNLRKAFEKETQLFFESIMRENRSVLELLDANYTFLNERLAKHYGIEGVRGERFRKVALPPGSPRGGLLGQGSILMATSYPNRTSPVIRGKWILENVFGAPPPPPPPNVPELKDSRDPRKVLPMRERLAAHRANPACAGCHAQMDQLGFALENFDAIGEWRDLYASGAKVDASAQLPDGSKFNGPAELRKVLLSHSDEFLTTMTEKLMVYALGRGLEAFDAPAVRKIKRDATRDNYRFEALIQGIVTSTPFTMRTAQDYAN